MDPIQAIVLAIVQGLSEFLPVSSSGHLILVPHFFGWTDQGLAFDVAVHVGTLAAVLGYFRRELIGMATGLTRSLVHREQNEGSRLAWAVIVGTIPAGVVGLTLNDFIETNLRSPLFVAGTLSFWGIVMYLADRFSRQQREESSVGWRDGLIIGLAQALALFPGTSRSGITMTAGLALGLTRTAAARISFLIGVPAIAMAGGYEFLKLAQSPDPVDVKSMALGIGVAALTGYACIHWLLKWLPRIGLLPFTIYRLLIAAVIVWHFA
ncbi:MAG: undecaprenyl-diphosphate phosphatase [Steroidobacteraceae bacterium]|nr:undecaprenyl-diphosphate phosphatase [Steroidobacteraceae bacterium]MCC7200476.1 undecaprenyl-diphosphate phosphatase [Gammaproteobacteria bacterium]